MAKMYEEFMEGLRVEPAKSVPKTEKEMIEELTKEEQKQYYEWALNRKKRGKEYHIEFYLLEHGRREFAESRKQRMKNKYDNWVLKRKEEGKDYSQEWFDKLKAYLKREQQKFNEILENLNKQAVRIYNSGRGYLASDEIMYRVKQDLYKWRDQDKQYQSMKQDIEELRCISDKPVQSLEDMDR